MSKSLEFKLLEEEPQHFIKKYQPLIQRVVLAHIEQSYLGKLNEETLLKGVQKRLPKYTQALHKRHGKDVFLKSLLIEACRMLCHHVEDIHLLQYHSNNLIIKYKAIVYSRVYSFVNTDQLHNDQADDLIQEGLETLLKKFKRENFVYEEGRAMFRTYLYSVINSAIKDGLRRMRSKKASIGSRDAIKASHAVDENTFKRVSNKLDMEKQCELYGQFLDFFKWIDRAKFELKAKVNYRLLLKNKDVHSLPLNEDVKVELLVSYRNEYTEMSLEETWNT